MLRWGIIGTGNIARAFALAVNLAENCHAFAVAGRNSERARDFAARHSIERSFDTVDEMLLSDEVDAVYVAVPHTVHPDMTLKALESGKHVLCEKPMAISFEEVAAMQRKALEKKRVLLEGYMYRFHPQTAELIRLLRSGILGRVRSMDIAFGFKSHYDGNSRLWRPELGGGAIWDIGGYPVSMANLVAATMNGCRFLEPDRITGVAEFRRDGIDVRASGIIHYPNGIIARVSCAIDANEGMQLKIFGELGNIIVEDPWQADRSRSKHGEIILERNGCEPEVYKANAYRTSYGYEAAYFTDLVEGLRFAPGFPVMTSGESLLQIECLERWMAAVSNCPCASDA